MLILALVLCFVAVVSDVICLFAGSFDGVLNDLAILTLNTSRIEINLPRQWGNSDRQIDDLLSFVRRNPATIGVSAEGGSHGADSATSSLSDTINEAGNSLSDQAQETVQQASNSVLQSLGIQDFYSVHLLSICEGNFLRNSSGGADAPVEIKRNVTKCTGLSMDHALEPGPLLQTFSGSDSDVLSGVVMPQHAPVDPTLLRYAPLLMAIPHCLTTVGTFLAFVTIIARSLPVLGWISGAVTTSLLAASTVTLLLSNVIITLVAIEGVKVIDDWGSDFGVQASTGGTFLFVTWVAWLATVGALLSTHLADFRRCLCCCL